MHTKALICIHLLNAYLHKVRLVHQYFSLYSLYFTETAITSSYMIRFLRSWCRFLPLVKTHNLRSVIQRLDYIWQNFFNFCRRLSKLVAFCASQWARENYTKIETIGWFLTKLSLFLCCFAHAVSYICVSFDIVALINICCYFIEANTIFCM